ncbi:4-hydroxy-3-methylbut-2-enyl diphosphate reductase [Entomospira culicis]|uniref:4-hydroxy-3-methylbut-2-enyl diphosphate reductase n=1 Tax=Entomospira culicis TaxID=2719989 RepID=A0A968KTV6_9SPIO|nr:4-hydroxy-3-methylbut-2-enyl diphosphate reductase [Entomospira culicis]NIZ18639.1 4-hydroxy-3-methylbut-2-enyl diphosphate reductase [Entomospira culicis]NIZ68854.1 4-hydroxy-3-methylbut-2-enyl diphosphate reductase [Entomospira culicis]WDI37448.1 4-hydroxy-3-methylbut-2-enyl diphosphate reductase [Entomospira culicis]WDI39076.1 4-hydroxy-3-methylbut-2-enyl diphosphate reductase [Entomospira culicis]
MPKIIRAKSMGYCMGVERAVRIAEENIGQDKSLRSLGLLIHNEIENQRLAGLGLGMSDLETLAQTGEGDRLLIRAHGLDPQVRASLEKRGYQLIDATCPLVVMNQKDVQKAREAGYHVVIVGKSEHAEIIAMRGFADPKKLSVIGSVAEASALDIDAQEIFVLSQTTLRPDLFNEIKTELAKRYQLKEFRPSICPATQDRQKAVKELAKEVDAIVVVGDKNSANTKGLVESAEVAGVAAYLVSQASMLDLGALQHYERIGLTAGASVPSYLIDEVEASLRNL